MEHSTTDNPTGMTKEQNHQDWMECLERCGLRVVEGTVPHDAQPVSTAIYAVTGIAVQPTATVRISSDRAADELDEAWHHHASACALYDDKGEFLILPPISGGSEIGWVRVTDPIGERLPSRIASGVGWPEFLTISTDGRHLCAVSVEEDEYWVVQHELQSRPELTSRIKQRIKRDYPEAEQPAVASILVELSDEISRYENAQLERIIAATLIHGQADVDKLLTAVQVALSDWRDVLMGSGLEHSDWPARLNCEFGVDREDSGH
ncbi:hypothetical protein ACWCV9_05940 [Streptomyces sp. NPDC001606]